MLKLITMNLIYLLRLNPNPPSDFLKVSSPHPLLVIFLSLIFSTMSLPDRKDIFLSQMDKAT